MPTYIKAIVFRTAQLKATKDFFENIIKLPINESSERHFVLYSKSIRLVFVEAFNDFAVEIFMTDKINHLSKKLQLDISIADFKKCIDPNGIGVIII